MIAPQVGLSTPTFTRADNDFEIAYTREHLIFHLEAVNETASGMVYAEVTVTSDMAALSGKEIAWDRVQLNSSTSRDKLALTITKAYKGEGEKKADPTYITMLHELSRGVVNRIRKGEEIVTVMNPQRRKNDAYLLRPTILEGQVNGLYGDGNTGKGWVAIAFMVAMLHGGVALGMTGRRIKSALYVDYETDQSEIEDRVARFCDGMGIAPVSFDYHRGSLSIPQEVRAIRRQMKRHEFTIWDSLGAGMTEKANDPGVAAACINALRTLENTVLFLDHTNKAGGQIGSVYKRNLCRNLWLAQKHVDGVTGRHHVTMYDKKGNNTGQRKAIGLDFQFQGEVGPVRAEPSNARAQSPASTGGRPRKYDSDAERQKAHREKIKGNLHVVEEEEPEEGDGEDGPE